MIVQHCRVLAGVGCTVALVAWACAPPSHAQFVEAPNTKAVIRFSNAPWDDSAYDLRIPLTTQAGASGPIIRIDIWGNPEYQKPKTLRILAEGGPTQVGRALYQPVLDKSLPETLTGTVSFDGLKKGTPVTGSYDLSTAKGRKFRGRFLAKWGNTSDPRHEVRAGP